ncbi:MAG: hypothetical protein ACLP9S_18110 [Syntrophales bacterium]
MNFRENVHDLPLLHIEGKDEETKGIILTSVKECCEKLGLRLEKQDISENDFDLVYSHKYGDDMNAVVVVTYISRLSFICL